MSGGEQAREERTGRTRRSAVRIRTNTIIGMSAILLSGITAGAVIWQARVAADQRAASVWPHVQAWPSRGVDPPRFAITLMNAGVGPAVIRYFAVRVDGEPVRSWREFLAALSADEGVRRAAFNEGVVRGSGWVMSPNIAITAFSTSAPEAVNVLAAPAWSRIQVTFCYCSIFERCWMSEWDVALRDEPTRVRACPSEGKFGVDWAELDAPMADT